MCIPNKIEDLNLSEFNMLTEINELKTLTKHTLSECKCEFDGRISNSDQWWNNDKCWCECKKCYECEKDYIWNPTTCSFKNGKYLGSIMDDSAIMCDEIIESYKKETKIIPTNFISILCYYTFIFVTSFILVLRAEWGAKLVIPGILHLTSFILVLRVALVA